MNPLVAIVVYWCVASAPFDSFNPHQVDAVKKFIEANPATCHATLGDVLTDRDVLVEQCNRQQIVYFMPSWLQRPENQGHKYMGAKCFEEERVPLDITALKRRVSPP